MKLGVIFEFVSLTLFNKMFPPTLLCRIFGHNWRFKDTTKWIKLNGEKYLHTKTRRCIRCDQRDYLYEKWISEEKVSKDDKESIC